MNNEQVIRQCEEALEHHKNEFEEFFLVRFFNLQFSYEDESCTVVVPVSSFMYNPHGALHGGIISLILDASMGHLCNKVVGPAVTIEMKTQYLRPVKFGKIKCKAIFIKKGRKILSMKADMVDENEKLIAIGTATWMPV